MGFSRGTDIEIDFHLAQDLELLGQQVLVPPGVVRELVVDERKGALLRLT